MLADELSLGLAPKVVNRLVEVLRGFAARGGGVLLVEQQIGYALQAADHVYVMRRGEIALEGSSAQMRRRVPEIEACYFSMDNANGAPTDERVAAAGEHEAGTG